jgi:predicted ATPase
LALPLKPLTLLAGVNGGGKSTVLQALVLLHQALTDNGVSGMRRNDLPLNGSLLTLGSVRDVVDKSQGGKHFRIGLTHTCGRIEWEFEGGRDELAVRLLTTKRRLGVATKTVINRHALFPKRLVADPGGGALFRMLAGARYVPADRVGPAEAYPLLEPDRHNTLGPRAERAVGAIYWQGENDVVPGVRHPNESYPLRLDRQVQAWLNDLFPGVLLQVGRVTDVQGIPTANLVTLGLRTSAATDFHRPQHVGFGITYALPILVALLSSAPGDLVLLENPEAHLHPRAQVRIAELCVRAANSGIQVLLETHSDHVLNGVRVCVHRRKIPPDNVSVHFFDRPKRDSGPGWRELHIGLGGRLNERPNGFFDEIERQLSELLEPFNDDA